MFCAARRKTRAKRAEIRSAQQKRPCQPKTAKRFFGGPVSQGPSGQAKEQTRILPVRRGFSAPGVPRRLPGLAVLALPAAVVGVFVSGVPALFLPVCRWLVSGRRAASCRFCANFCARCPVCPPCALCVHFRLVLAVCSPVLCCVRGFSLLSFAFFCLTFASQISFHLSLRPRRASTFFRKESRQRFAKGLRPFEPHSCALRLIFFSSALLAGLAALRPQTAG